MRWTSPREGDVRVKKWFAFLPAKAGEEYRWLETVTVEQKYYIGCGSNYWRNLRFIEESTEGKN